MKFGLMCNGFSMQQWQIEAVTHLLNDGHECKLLIINANKVPQSDFLKKLKTYPYKNVLIRFWYRYILRVPSLVFGDTQYLLKDIPSIHCSTSQKGLTGYFSDQDVNDIQANELDFILRFGFGIMKGKILDSAKYGIWSFHHDDETKYRGVPIGFWEILYNDPVNAAILQRLTPTLDGGVILFKGYFKTISHSWNGNLNKLLKSTTEWPALVCKRIENEGFPVPPEKQTTISPLRFLPGNLVMLRFLLKTAINRILFHLREMFLSENWQIAYSIQDTHRLNPQSEWQMPVLQWLNARIPSSAYLADPFGYCKDGIVHLLCEYYDYRDPKGKIVSVKIDAATNEVLRFKTALEKEYHLAFPYLFEYEGDMYCLPENSVGGTVDLYKYNPETGILILEKTLVENLQAVDTVLFEYNNKWWLFFTDRIATSERLNIWFSDSFTGVYKPHPLNPVKTDIRSSRPAGQPFIRNGALYRPAQDCSLRSGWRIAVNKIDTLSETSFSEHTVNQINAPDNPSGLAGMHTFALSENLLVVDAKKEIFIASSFKRKFKQIFHKVLKINK